MTGSLRYDPIAVTLHWLIALLIIGMLALGFLMEDFPGSIRPLAYTLHKSTGITILALSLFRLVWRLLNPPPALPAAMPRHLKLAAKATHWLFYVLILAMPLSGWLMVSASQKYPTVFFWIGEVPFIPMPTGIDGKATAHMFGDYHLWFAYSTLLLLALHLGAALKHHFVDRDTVLTRMLPRWVQR